jgi:hypothetical protein
MPVEDSLAQLPSFKLDFKPQPAIPGVVASPVFVLPVVCSSDGVPFVDFPDLTDPPQQTVYSLDPKGARAFSAKSVTGLYDIRFQSFFAADSIVGILVNATKDDKHSESTYYPMPGISKQAVPYYTGEHHDYVVEYDRDGNYKSTVDLPTAYHFWRVAALSDGSLLALAYDRANSAPRLLLLDSGGQIVRTLLIPSKMLDSPDLRQGESRGALNLALGESSLSWWLFAPSRNQILLYQAHARAPVLEVGAGGAVREVPLEAPKGYVLDSIVPANDRWIVRYSRKGASNGPGAVDARPESGNYALYVVNSSDGSLETRIDPGTGPLFNIACEQDGVFTAFSMDSDRVIRETADIPR